MPLIAELLGPDAARQLAAAVREQDRQRREAAAATPAEPTRPAPPVIFREVKGVECLSRAPAHVDGKAVNPSHPSPLRVRARKTAGHERE